MAVKKMTDKELMGEVVGIAERRRESLVTGVEGKWEGSGAGSKRKEEKCRARTVRMYASLLRRIPKV